MCVHIVIVRPWGRSWRVRREVMEEPQAQDKAEGPHSRDQVIYTHTHTYHPSLLAEASNHVQMSTCIFCDLTLSTFAGPPRSRAAGTSKLSPPPIRGLTDHQLVRSSKAVQQTKGAIGGWWRRRRSTTHSPHSSSIHPSIHASYMHTSTIEAVLWR